MAEVDSQDQGFVILDTILQLGADAGVVGFPKGECAMTISACTAEMVTETGMSLGGLMRSLATEIEATEAWGTRVGGRIVAPISVPGLITRCVETILAAL